ncbi:MAG: thermonuclease family protein, partial [Acidimicrobiia bacterium]
MRRHSPVSIILVLLVGVIACRSVGGTEEDLSIVVSDAPEVGVTGVDGDSLRGDDGTEYRLAAINAPDSPECLAEAAAARLAGLVGAAGGTISITQPDEPVDQFDRQLIYAFVDDGATFVNQVLVEDGLALAIHAGADPSTAEILFAAQDRAREDGVGIWDPQACGEGAMDAVEILDVVANPPGPDEEVLDYE